MGVSNWCWLHRRRLVMMQKACIRVALVRTYLRMRTFMSYNKHTCFLCSRRRSDFLDVHAHVHRLHRFLPSILCERHHLHHTIVPQPPLHCHSFWGKLPTQCVCKIRFKVTIPKRLHNVQPTTAKNVSHACSQRTVTTATMLRTLQLQCV